MKTYSAKPSEVARKWYVIDASEAPLGRVATQAATLLTGKAKPMFTQHIDCGDYVIITNAERLVVSGNKLTAKKYYHHSGYPGGLRERSLSETLKSDPGQVITRAVRGMLPVNKLRPDRLLRLKIYKGAEHQHEAQKPQVISMKAGK